MGMHAAWFRIIVSLLLGSALLVSGCSNGDDQASRTPPHPPTSFVEDLATSVIVEMGMSAWEKGCQDGNTFDCKILFSKEHGEYDDAEVKQKLDGMNDKLDTINLAMGQIQQKVDNLAGLLKVTAEDLKVDSKQNFLTQYEVPVRSAYDAFKKADFRSSSPDEVANFCTEVMTFPLNSQYQYNVPQNLEMIHGNLIDESGGGNGLFDKLDSFFAAKWTSPVSAGDAENTYNYLEKSFGFVLGDQAKGVAVIAACYKYYEKHPEAMQDIHLDERTLEEYLAKKYRPNVEAQVQRFLGSVEKFIARATDVNKAGDDAPWSWVSAVLFRADLMATWVRVAAGIVPQNAPAPLQYPFRHLVVRVAGEPDRVALFHQRALNGGLVYKGFPVPPDPNVMGPDGNSAEVRHWAVGPYLQFPVHLDLPQDDLKRLGAVKAARTLDMVRFSYTKHDYSRPEIGGGYLHLNNNAALPAWLADVPVHVYAYGPDGAVIGDITGKDPHDYIIFGHSTLILKETANRIGKWSKVAAGRCAWESGSAWNTADISVATPRYIHQSMDVVPSIRLTNDCRTSPAYCYWRIAGNACYSVGFQAQYYFEGWGDLSPSQTVLAFDGTTTQSAAVPQYGTYAIETHLSQTTPSVTEKVFSQAGNLGPVAPTVVWKAGDTVTVDVLSRITSSLDITVQGYQPDEDKYTFHGSNKVALNNLTLKIGQ